LILSYHRKNISEKGFTVVKSIYTDTEVDGIIASIDETDKSNPAFRKTSDLFAIRQYLKEVFAVQPPTEILKNNFTIRIHLDNTDENNGALKVISGSQSKGVHRAQNISWDQERQTICRVDRGGVMIMRPLLMHASERTTNNERRRVIHIEFSKADLPGEIDWAELDRIL
jgi:hypothetical protein